MLNPYDTSRGLRVGGTTLLAGHVKLLLDAHPEAAATPDADGFSPLHVALAAAAPLEIVKLLLDAHPEATATPHPNGWLPLHVAARVAAPLEVVKMLLDAHPGAASTLTATGDLPLHIALTAEAVHLGIVKTLLDTHPEATTTPGEGGLLPLHVAVAEKAVQLEVLMMLLPSQLPVAEAIIAAATYFSHCAGLTGLSGLVLAGFITLGAFRHVTRCIPSVGQHWPWADISGSRNVLRKWHHGSLLWTRFLGLACLILIIPKNLEKMAVVMCCGKGKMCASGRSLLA